MLFATECLIRQTYFLELLSRLRQCRGAQVPLSTPTRKETVSSGRQERIPQLVDAEETVEIPAPSPAAPRFTISEFAVFFGIEENVIRDRIARGPDQREYYSIGELAERWRVSRGTVYNRLRSAGAKVLDFAAPGKRSKKAVHVKVVFRIEAQRTKRLC